MLRDLTVRLVSPARRAREEPLVCPARREPLDLLVSLAPRETKVQPGTQVRPDVPVRRVSLALREVTALLVSQARLVPPVALVLLDQPATVLLDTLVPLVPTVRLVHLPTLVPPARQVWLVLALTRVAPVQLVSAPPARPVSLDLLPTRVRRVPRETKVLLVSPVLAPTLVPPVLPVSLVLPPTLVPPVQPVLRV